MNAHLIFQFLKELKENNNKEWFEANRESYQEIRKELEILIQFILKELTPIDPDLSTLAVKDCMFRINRDIRFSNDKTPYKTNIGIVFSPGGKNSGNPSYYLHLEPGNKSFTGGGIYMPSSEYLSKIRQEIDFNSEDLKKILNDKKFKKFYKELYGEEKLKKAPKGYPSDHPDIELLKVKHYIVLHSIADKDIETGFENKVLQAFKALKPFNDFLKVAIS